MMHNNSRDIVEATGDDGTATVQEASALYSVSTKTIYRWIADGRLQGYRVGPKLIRLKKSQLEAAMRPVASASAAEGQ